MREFINLIDEDRNAPPAVTEPLWEMTNIYPRTSGVPALLWVSPRGNASHGCRVKVSATAKWTGDSFSVTVPDCAIVGKSPYSTAEMNKIFAFIKANETLILQLWNGDIDGVEFARGMKSV